LLISCQYSLTAIFSRIRLIPNRQHYMFSGSHFFEDQLLAKPLPTTPPLRQMAVVLLATDRATLQLPSLGGAQ
jgi:hypothetical protein